MDENKICFVIMPISDIPDYDKGHFNRVYDHIIKPAVKKAGLIPLSLDSRHLITRKAVLSPAYYIIPSVSQAVHQRAKPGQGSRSIQ